MIFPWILRHSSGLFYLVPFLPCIIYIGLVIHFREILRGVLTPGERDTDRNRTIIGLMAGFAFAGIAAISVLKNDQKKDFGLEISLYYLVISFLCYLIAINLEGYKFFTFLSILGDLLVDIADLAFLCCVLSFVFSTGYSETTKWLIFGFVSIAWLLHYSYLIKCHFDSMRAIKERLEKSKTNISLTGGNAMANKRIFELTNFTFIADSNLLKSGSIYIKGLSRTEGLPDGHFLRILPNNNPTDETIHLNFIETHPYQGNIEEPLPIGVVAKIILPNWAKKIMVHGERKEIIEHIHMDSHPLIMPARVFNYCIKHGVYMGDSCPYNPPHDI